MKCESVFEFKSVIHVLVLVSRYTSDYLPTWKYEHLYEARMERSQRE